MLIVSIIIAAIIGFIFIFLQQPQFGKTPSKGKLQQIQQSFNYKEGQFQNVNPTPQLTGNVGVLTVMKEFFFNKDKRNVPLRPLPSKKTNLLKLDRNENVLVWFGHSSYFMQVDGKRFLIDPVLSGHASPIKFITQSFKGSDVYSVHDIPPIDFLLLTHDHYDHLDYATIKRLKPKIDVVITGLGVGAHLKHWGYDEKMIIEKNWNEQMVLDDKFIITTTPARHFSGRKFKRNLSLWLSFVLATPTKKIFIGGDSGYDTHFKIIGEEFGPFDLAILENGQYNQYWKHIHMMPEEVVQAAQDLKAKKLLPLHWAKFSLSLHAWDEPITRLLAEAKRKEVEVLHPMIGETVYLDKVNQFSEWWKGL